MRKSTAYLILSLLFLSSAGFAQDETGKSTIAAIARYKDGAVELRWLPDNKTVLNLGFANSYTIQRRDSGAADFLDIATVKPFERATWEKMISTEADANNKSALEMSMEFLFAPKAYHDKPFGMEEGIGDMNDAKSKEDMVYALFVLSTIKSGKAAVALGLGYIDKTVAPASSYEYRIVLNASSPVYKVKDGMVSVRTVAIENKYRNEVFVYTGDTKLSFVWAANPHINGYFVERAGEGETKFKQLNTTPFYDSKGAGYEEAVNGSFDDDSLVNYKWYRYRFYGLTSFGDKVLFAEVKGMPKDLTPPTAPLVKQPEHIKPKQVSVSWQMTGNIADLRGFIVGRSDKDTGDFNLLHKRLLPAATRSFTDTGFSTESNNYYVVYALDTAGNISASYPAYVALTDSTPPAKPEIASTLIDSLGVVTITVKPGTEKDLKGYRVFKANDPEHEPSVIEEVFRESKSDTVALRFIFTDTVSLNSLTPKVYYKVKALDYNYNQSPFSEFAVVRRPDTIPPGTPVFTRVLVSEKEIDLFFAASESEDVKEQLMYRRIDTATAWTVLEKMKPSQQMLADTNVQPGKTYYYTLRAMDESGLYSPYSNAVYGKPYRSGVLPGIQNAAATINDGKVILKWDYPRAVGDVYFVVYRKNISGELVQLARVRENGYIDNKVSKSNVYAIRAVADNGDQSPLTPIITPTVKE
ncbi:MAG TPA: hypothetical protein VF145_04230 [Chitinophagaceae bacterium]